MAHTRRVVRKVEPAGDQYLEEQLWPVYLGLIVLGGSLIGVSIAYQPLEGVAWQRTAWPTIIGVPLVVVAAMVALAYFDNRLVRRSLQLSLVLCAIVHVALILQLLHTQLSSGSVQTAERQQQVIPQRPLKFVPEYHPTQFVPEEDRPRQDFEKPVETESPLPSREPERIVRQPTEQERSPAEPQPVPVPEQRSTNEPNVVNRPTPNEVAPRLAAQTSRLSRQTQPSQSRMSQPVALPAAERQTTAAAEVKASVTPVEQQQATATAAPPAASPQGTETSREATVARRTAEQLPDAPSAAERTPRAVTQPVAVPATAIAAAPAQPVSLQPAAAEAQATRTTATPERLSAAAPTPAENAPAPSESAATAVSAALPQRAMDAAVPATSALRSDTAAKSSRAVASAPLPVDTAATNPANSTASGSRVSTESRPARLAVNRAESGTAGSRRSPNLETSMAGANSPALLASSAARRAEATQRAAPGDALSPAAPAKIARSVAAADLPSSSIKVEHLAAGATAAVRQVAEATASSSAALTQADAAARRDAVTAAKGTGEIDFGPTQVIGEAGSGRASGGGQPEINLSGSTAPALARRSSGGPAAAASVVAAPSEVAASGEAATRPAEASPTATAAVRRDGSVGSADPSRQAAVQGGRPVDVTAAVRVSAASPGRAQVAGDLPLASSAATDQGTEGNASSLPRQGPAVAAAGSDANVAAIPEVGPSSAVAQAESDHLFVGAAQSQLTRTTGHGLAIDVVAPVGPGGLGTEFTPEVGINVRQANAESVHVELRAARFLRSQIGGLPAVSTAAVIPTDAFSSRAARVRGQEPAGGRGSPSPQTEEAIERGLAFLARYQRANGGWSLQGFPEEATLASDTAATALALLAFQGAGYNHRELQYRDVVRGGLAHLLQSQQENGDLFVPLDDASNKSVWLYSHSLAAIAMCEAYGMTQDPALREPAQKAIDFIVAAQEAQRGGWRYAPGVGADTSVSGWMMMALKSGELAGLDVSPTTYKKIARWLDSAQQSASEPHLYRYNPFAPDTAEQRHGRVTSKTMTAVGLLMRLYTGWRRDNPNMIRGAAFLGENLPAQGTARQPERDTYYWYYATQVMAHMGGEAWETWMAQLHPLLTNSQVRQGALAGSWDPRSPIADRWGPHAGRLYVTAMNLLSLEVQHRKLPLYEDVAR